MDKFTPGPWTWNGDSGVNAPAKDGYVCQIVQAHDPNAGMYITDVSRAIARLCGAAPDLLAACRIALEWLEDLHCSTSAAHAQIANAIHLAETGERRELEPDA